MHKGVLILIKSRKPHAFGELVESYLKHAQSYKASFDREKYAIAGLQDISARQRTYQR